MIVNQNLRFKNLQFKIKFFIRGKMMSNSIPELFDSKHTREMGDIAILITCYNRKHKTLACLQSLYNTNLKEIYRLDVFLVDDGSTDQTSESVKNDYPEVNVIKGNGKLFWNQGMRLAWETAAKKKDYQFYLWLNDDTILFKHALDELISCYYATLIKDKKEAIITGAIQTNVDSNNFSYGGRNEDGPVIPNGQVQPCKFINGNAVIVPINIYKKIGNLSNDYTHGMGDIDYGLSAIKSGFNCYTTRRYIGTCPHNVNVSEWCNPAVPLKRRLYLLNSPKGLNIKQYIIFRKKFWGNKWIIFALKVYLKSLFPTIYKCVAKLITK